MVSERLPKPFWWFLTASASSNLGDGILKVALPILAVRLSDSPALIAGVSLSLSLPWLLVALHAGAVVDRVDRKKTMGNVNLLRFVLVGVLAALIGLDGASVVAVYAIAFAVGCGETLYDTSAQSLLPALVDKRDLSLANGRLYGAELTLNQFVGPPLGGLLAGISLMATFGASSLAFLLGAMLLILVPGVFKTERPAGRTRITAEIAEGIRFVRERRILLVLAIVGAGANLAWSAWEAVFVIYALSSDAMGLSEFGYAAIRTLGAVGGLLGSIVVSRLENRLGPARILQLCIVGWAIWLAAPYVTTNVWIIGFVVLTGSITGVMFNVVVVSLRQSIVPDTLLGRVNATFRVLLRGAMPVGAGIGGLIGELVSVPAVFAVAGVFTLLLLLPLRMYVTDEGLRHVT